MHMLILQLSILRVVRAQYLTYYLLRSLRFLLCSFSFGFRFLAYESHHFYTRKEPEVNMTLLVLFSLEPTQRCKYHSVAEWHSASQPSPMGHGTVSMRTSAKEQHAYNVRLCKIDQQHAECWQNRRHRLGQWFARFGAAVGKLWVGHGWKLTGWRGLFSPRLARLRLTGYNQPWNFKPARPQNSNQPNRHCNIPMW